MGRGPARHGQNGRGTWAARHGETAHVPCHGPKAWPMARPGTARPARRHAAARRSAVPARHGRAACRVGTARWPTIGQIMCVYSINHVLCFVSGELCPACGTGHGEDPLVRLRPCAGLHVLRRNVALYIKITFRCLVPRERRLGIIHSWIACVICVTIVELE